MSIGLKELTSDQLRRIYRDYLKGVPKERLMKKYDITEGTFWEIVGLYAKKKHPNDVGNAEDIQGPLDLIVTNLDTGSGATENPIVARSPRDLRVDFERNVKEFDYDSPEEELRKKGGEVSDLVIEREDKRIAEERKVSTEAVKENKEATDAVLEELTEASKAERKALEEKGVESAKATEAPEVLAQRAKDIADKQLFMEVAGEEARERSIKEHAEKAAKEQKDAAKEGDEATAKLMKEAQENSEKEAEARHKEFEAKRKEAERAGQERAEREAEAGKRASDGSEGREGPDKTVGSGDANVGRSSADSTGNHPKAPTEGTAGGPVTEGNTSVTAKPTGNPVQPAKIEPDGLK